MGMMENTWYLPEEKLNYRNYPELANQEANIKAIVAYGLEVSNALTYYNTGVLSKIDIDVVQLQSYVSLCRSVTEVLGLANNVCFDIIVELREIQEILQSLMYISNRYGSQFIGKVSTSTSEVII